MASNPVKETHPMVVRQEIHVEAPPEQVWTALASQAELRRWFNEAMTFEARVGGWVEISGMHGNVPFHFGGKVLVFEPPSELTFEWDWIPARGWLQPTLLTIQLYREGNGTRVELRHYGFERIGERAHPVYESFQQGWDQSELVRLKQLVEEH